MSEATTFQVGGAQRVVRPAGEGQRRRLRWRHLWLVPGLGIAIFANELGKAHGVGILELIAFGIAPDVPRLFAARGRPMHNLLHQPIGPIVAVGVTATGIVPMIWLIGALVWLGHVIAGMAVGDVPRKETSRP